jgi:hypothetical protein
MIPPHTRPSSLPTSPARTPATSLPARLPPLTSAPARPPPCRPTPLHTGQRFHLRLRVPGQRAQRAAVIDEPVHQPRDPPADACQQRMPSSCPCITHISIRPFSIRRRDRPIEKARHKSARPARRQSAPLSRCTGCPCGPGASR